MKHPETIKQIVMSNQGTDCFLDLLITAADTMEKTEDQKRLTDYLKERKEINDIAPGTAGFDIVEMPWNKETALNDARFLLTVTEAAESEAIFAMLTYEADRDIVLPWLQTFAKLIRELMTRFAQ